MVNFIMHNENLIFVDGDNAIMISPYEDGNILFHSDRLEPFIIFSKDSDSYLEEKTYSILFETMGKLIGRFSLIGDKKPKLSDGFVDLKEKSIKITSLYKNATLELIYGDNSIGICIHKEILDSRGSVTLVTDGLKYYEYNDILYQMLEDLLNMVYSYNIRTSKRIYQKEYLS